MGVVGRDRSVDQSPKAIDPVRQESSILIFGLHNDTESFKGVKILRQRQGYTRPAAGICGVYDGVLVQFGNKGDARVLDTP